MAALLEEVSLARVIWQRVERLADTFGDTELDAAVDTTRCMILDTRDRLHRLLDGEAVA
jgi:hypothetical protein